MGAEQKQLEKSMLDVELWKSLLTADMNARYWSLIGRRYVERDRNAKIFLAIISSSALAGLGFWKQLPWAGIALSVLSTLTAVVIPALKYPDKVNKASDLAGTWMQIQFDYENLWLTPDGASGGVESLLIQYDNIKRRVVKAKIMELGLPIDNKLIERCYSQVLAARDLSEQ